MALTSKLTAIADAIRDKTGEAGTMTLAEMPDAIRGIETGSPFPPQAVTGISAKVGHGKVGLLFDDPADLSYQGYDIYEWAGTKVVRKAGSAPASQSDGTVVADSKTRDAYISTHLVDEGVTDGTTYYYGLFPYSTTGVYRTDASQVVSATPSAIAVGPVTNLAVSAGNARASVSWSDPSDVADTSARYGASWARTVLVRKAGSAPTSPSDGTVVVTETTRNRYSSTAYEDTGLTNGTEYFYAAFAVSSDGVASTAATASAMPTAFDPSSIAWATATDDEIATMLEKHYAGEIDVADYWQAGQSRSVSLSAMAATGVGDSHVAQTVELVIADFGTRNNGDNGVPALTSTQKSSLGTSRTKPALVFTQKNVLANGTNGENGSMNYSNVNAGGWDGCDRRTWCNSVYKAALPSSLQELLKLVNIITSQGSTSHTTATTSEDYIFLPAEKEIVGTDTKYADSTAESSLSQWQWFATSSNRIKKAGVSGSARTWLCRSPVSGSSSFFCYIGSDGTINSGNASSSRGGAPSACI